MSHNHSSVSSFAVDSSLPNTSSKTADEDVSISAGPSGLGSHSTVGGRRRVTVAAAAISAVAHAADSAFVSVPSLTIDASASYAAPAPFSDVATAGSPTHEAKRARVERAESGALEFRDILSQQSVTDDASLRSRGSSSRVTTRHSQPTTRGTRDDDDEEDDDEAVASLITTADVREATVYERGVGPASGFSAITSVSADLSALSIDDSATARAAAVAAAAAAPAPAAAPTATPVTPVRASTASKSEDKDSFPIIAGPRELSRLTAADLIDAAAVADATRPAGSVVSALYKKHTPLSGFAKTFMSLAAENAGVAQAKRAAMLEQHASDPARVASALAAMDSAVAVEAEVEAGATAGAARAWASLFSHTAASPLAVFGLIDQDADATTVVNAWATAVATNCATPLVEVLTPFAQRALGALEAGNRPLEMPEMLCTASGAARGAALSNFVHDMARGVLPPVSEAAPLCASSSTVHLATPRMHRAISSAHAEAVAAPQLFPVCSRKRSTPGGDTSPVRMTACSPVPAPQPAPLRLTAATPVALQAAATDSHSQSAVRLGAEYAALLPNVIAASLWSQGRAADPAQSHGIFPLPALHRSGTSLGYMVTASEQRAGDAPSLAGLECNHKGILDVDQVDAMLIREGAYTIDAEYLSRVSQISTRMRAILIDWLSELSHEYTLGRETFHLAVANFDRFLDVSGRAEWYRAGVHAARINGTEPPALPEPFCNRDFKVSVDQVPEVSRINLQLIGIACLSISAKLEENNPPSTSDLVVATDGAYSQRQILATEVMVLHALQWNLNPPTPYSYVRQYLRALVNNVGVPSGFSSRKARGELRAARAAERAHMTTVDHMRLAEAANDVSVANAAVQNRAARDAARMNDAAAAGKEVVFDDACFAGGDDDFDVVNATSAEQMALAAARTKLMATIAQVADNDAARIASEKADRLESAMDQAEEASESAAAMSFPDFLLSEVAPAMRIGASAPGALPEATSSSRVASFLSGHRFSRVMELLDVALLDPEHVQLPPSALSAAAVALVYPEARRVIPSVFDRAALAPALVFISRFTHLPFLCGSLPARPFYRVNISAADRHTRQTYHPNALALVEAILSQNQSFCTALTIPLINFWNSVWCPAIE